MMLLRVALLALLVACAGISLGHALDDVPAEQDIDNNEVLPENDVVKARVDEVAATTPPPTDSPTTAETTTSSAPGSSTPPEEETPPSTTAPPKAGTTLSRFLSDIIQIPIAVIRSVSSFLGNAFSSRHGAPDGDSSSQA